LKLFDTSAIIFFLNEIPKFDCINHLCHMSENINISRDVYNEYIEDNLKDDSSSVFDLRHSNTLDIHIKYDRIKILIMEINALTDQIKRRYPNLGNGEISIIALGMLMKDENNNYCCVLDDGPARSVAIKYDLELTGSIGLLIKIRDNNGWDNKKMQEIINTIRVSDFRVSEDLLGRLLW
jgi:predicted nucleic acid-binding protein